MKSLFLLAAIIGCVFGQNEQNLCGTRTNPADIIFVNDPADCAKYLWCNFNATTNALDSVHQGLCPTQFNFNPTAAACDAQYVCPTLCNDVGVVTEPALRVADVADTECRSFFVCATGVPGTTIFNCTAPFVFNRNFGFCTSEESAPCNAQGGGGTPPSSACTEAGIFEDLNRRQDCSDFKLCAADLTETQLTCSDPLQHFNPATKGCDLIANRVPACPVTPPQVTFGPNIPTPPLINVPRAMEKKLRERFAHFLRN